MERNSALIGAKLVNQIDYLNSLIEQLKSNELVISFDYENAYLGMVLGKKSAINDDDDDDEKYVPMPPKSKHTQAQANYFHMKRAMRSNELLVETTAKELAEKIKKEIIFYTEQLVVDLEKKLESL